MTRPVDLAILGAALVTCAAACKRPPSTEECGRMLDRYVDMTAGRDPALAGLPETRAAEVRDAKRAAKRLEPSYGRSLEQCRSEVSRAEYDCAMAAPTPNDWEACIE